MLDLNKEREAFEASEYVKTIIHKFEWSEEFNNYQIKDCVINGNIFDLLEAKNDEQLLNGAWFGWQEKAKAQAVSDTHIVVPRTREVVVAIEKIVQQQCDASGVQEPLHRLDGWRILEEIAEKVEEIK
ncbi:hypothetical protein HBK86_06615 [Acinetobacter baumannii]|uniref:hypothetical protein n=1 Tax=Acinetobacter baumannii TaxID=470 RepID=UPI0010C81339|nr:hypothetical protein [Acinetobacter baumannii]ELA9599614.1 hypothetical protein [Acinetobacter baumannii]NDM33808.1 hypothetical protein [Acinetobacter baumannii]NDW79628.1 hypothetical protein [Acinetobacter baumannii]NDW94740.1 hypothetical protein [Acinetobacter baumannii]QCP23329.1 hypothetical protein FDF35_06590 [Acinetobacter baumannii]